MKKHDDGMIDLGFRFFKSEWNKGYASESAMASLDYGFNHLGLEEITGRASKENKASKMSLSAGKKGFHLFGVHLTLEPVIFLFVFFNALMSGAKQTNNLLLLKICRYELGYNETVCDNRAEYEDVQVEVQKVFNM